MLNKEDQIECIDQMINQHKVRIEVLELMKNSITKYGKIRGFEDEK